MEIIFELLKKIRPELNFKESNDFIKDGMLDSLDMIQLVSELENIFRISIDGMDILPENFASIDAIASLIKKSGGTI